MTAPLAHSSRVRLRTARSWIAVFRALFLDEEFQRYAETEGFTWSAKQLGTALSTRDRDLSWDTAPETLEPRPNAASQISAERAAAQIDTQAKLALAALSLPQQQALFAGPPADGDEDLRPAAQAIAAYFAAPAAERTPPTEFFSARHYLSQLADPPGPEVDPFAHFLVHADEGGTDPHPFIQLSRLTASGADSPAPLEAFCDLLSGEPLDFHPLVDLEFILAQPSAEDWSALDVLGMVSDRETPLPVSPHPLFDVEYYRASNGAPGLNELWHYRESGSGALKTHPLISPDYFAAVVGPTREGRGETLLERYLARWPQGPGNPSLFVELPHLNHQLSLLGLSSDGEPLTRALRAGVSAGMLFHPNLDEQLLAFAFSNLAPKTSRVADYVAALSSLPSADPASGNGGPKVSAVIVTYFKPLYTALSIFAAINALRDLDYEIIVVENAGELIDHEELRRTFSAHPQVKWCKLPANRFFGEGNNIGIEQASGDYVLFLNNDCCLSPDFGQQFRAVLDKSGALDALGVTLLFPDGKIQEFGGVIGDDGQVIQSLKQLDQSFLNNCPDLARADYSSAACLLLSRRALDLVAGFDPMFEPLYYEDTDLCRRLKAVDIPLYVSKHLRAVHVENATTREFLGSGFGRQIARNREAFARRWLKNGGADVYVRTERSRARPAGKRPRALVYTPFDVRPGGGERYLLGAASALGRDHDVVLATPSPISHARVEFVCHEMGVAPFAFDIVALPELTGSERQFDLSFVMGNEIVPPIPAMAKRNLYHLQFPFPWRNAGAYRFDRLSSYDALIVNSSYTADWTARRLREVGLSAHPPVEIVHPPVQPIAPRPSAKTGPKSQLHLLNVGRFFVGGHSKRQDVFLQILSGLRARGVDATATLVGPVFNDTESEAFFERVRARAVAMGDVEILRHASRQELEAEFARADVYLHCCGFQVDLGLWPELAEHYGIAVAEAIQAGCYPVVVAAGGPLEIIAEAGVGASYRTIPQAVEAILDFANAPTEVAPNPDWLQDLGDEAFADRLIRVAGQFAGKQDHMPNWSLDAAE